MSTASQTSTETLKKTPLAEHLTVACTAHQGALTPSAFSSFDDEIVSLTASAGIYDLGYRAYAKITGNDRLRWMNGMVTNTIQGLPEGHWNYSFLLNAQGRIQGDCNVYRSADSLTLQTDRSQITALLAHLDHFIIMDDVELHPLDDSQTAIGIAGPGAEAILTGLGAAVPEPGAFIAASLNDAEVTLVRGHSPLVPRFEVWLPPASLDQIWVALQNAGAKPCGIAAVEALRVAEATPLYGVDIQDKHLAQETAQTRALNFSKGCYLGQEIVERIRSRATVHRTLRQFSVENAPPALEPGQSIEVNAEGAERNPVGELTSLAHYHLPAFSGALALGFIRTEPVDRGQPLSHSAGAVTVLSAPPVLHP